MGKETGISWTDHSFNPWWGCSKVSPGCQNCYAETFAIRTNHDVWGKNGKRRQFSQKHWNEPLAWNESARKEGKTHRVFCASMCDVFEDHPVANEERDRLWSLIRLTPHLTWQLLTKRPENIHRMIRSDWGNGWPNVWLGTSVEDQQRADERIPVLVRIPARIRWLSVEPLLSEVDLSRWLNLETGRAGEWRQVSDLPDNVYVDWVVAGGESGSHRRPMELAWMQSLLDQCKSAHVPFWCKQDSNRIPGQQGRIPDEIWKMKQFPK